MDNEDQPTNALNVMASSVVAGDQETFNSAFASEISSRISDKLVSMGQNITQPMLSNPVEIPDSINNQE